MSFLRRLRSHRSQKPQIQTQHLQPRANTFDFLSPNVSDPRPAVSPISPAIVISPPSHSDSAYDADDKMAYMAPSPTLSVATTSSVLTSDLAPSQSQKRRNAAWERAANRIHENKSLASPASSKRSIDAAQPEVESDPRASLSSWLGARTPQTKAEMDFEAWLREI